jgi:cobalamin biosynthesis Mg chelatase CobN
MSKTPARGGRGKQATKDGEPHREYSNHYSRSVMLLEGVLEERMAQVRVSCGVVWCANAALKAQALRTVSRPAALQLNLLVQENSGLKRREATLQSAIGSLAGSVSAATAAVMACSTATAASAAADAVAAAAAAAAAADGSGGGAASSGDFGGPCSESASGGDGAVAASSGGGGRADSPAVVSGAASLVQFGSNISDRQAFLVSMQQREMAVQVCVTVV